MNKELKNLIDSFESLDPKGQVKVIKTLRELDAIDTYDKIHQWFLNGRDEKVRDEALKTLKRFDKKLQAAQERDAHYSARIANHGRMDRINPFKPHMAAERPNNYLRKGTASIQSPNKGRQVSYRENCLRRDHQGLQREETKQQAWRIWTPQA